MRWLSPVLPALAWALIVGGATAMDWWNIPGEPRAPYNKGPTMTGKTQVTLAPLDQIDAICRGLMGKWPKEFGPKPYVPLNRSYNECYDPHTDQVVVPMVQDKRLQQQYVRHGMGHARGGAHDDARGFGEWVEASWAAHARERAKSAIGEAVQALIAAGNVDR